MGTYEPVAKDSIFVQVVSRRNFKFKCRPKFEWWLGFLHTIFKSTALQDVIQEDWWWPQGGSFAIGCPWLWQCVWHSSYHWLLNLHILPCLTTKASNWQCHKARRNWPWSTANSSCLRQWLSSPACSLQAYSRALPWWILSMPETIPCMVCFNGNHSLHSELAGLHVTMF